MNTQKLLKLIYDKDFPFEIYNEIKDRIEGGDPMRGLMEQRKDLSRTKISNERVKYPRLTPAAIRTEVERLRGEADLWDESVSMVTISSVAEEKRCRRIAAEDMRDAANRLEELITDTNTVNRP